MGSSVIIFKKYRNMFSTLDHKIEELQKKEDPKNNRMQAAYDEKERVAGDKEEKKQKKAKEKRAGIEDVKDAEEYFDNNNEAPPGWRDARTQKQKDDKEKPILMTRSDYAKELLRRKRVKKKIKFHANNQIRKSKQILL